ncbi:hypothetical protein AB4090_12895 [Acidithiobacillus sp. IBUN Pt1247-S3]|uniref:hypothetical protein n=1 Tax=Acidithiobacillus sp. IBUN Pt1247-S3 TaxID=3166642 RepID=UPI0034E447CE
MNDKEKLAGAAILVGGIGLDARKEAVFRMAFRMNRKANYGFLEAGDTQAPNLAIADLDSPDGLAGAEKFRQEHPDIPLLATTIVPENFTNFVTLAKPIRMETLFPALDHLLHPSQPAPILSSQQTIEQAGKTNHLEHRATQENIPASKQMPIPPIANPSWDPDKIEYFDPEQGLLALVNRAIRDHIPVGIVDRRDGKLLWRIFPEQEKVEASVSMEEAQSIFRHGESDLILRADASFAATDNLYSMTLTEYLWQIHAIAADGRLSKKIPLNHPIKLRRWPNLTRLHPLPEALRLAAFLARSPASPALTIRMLRVQSQALFNFLAAADALELLDYSSAGTGILPEHIASAVTAVDVPKANPTKRGLLGRLLSKIAGL